MYLPNYEKFFMGAYPGIVGLLTRVKILREQQWFNVEYMMHVKNFGKKNSL